MVRLSDMTPEGAAFLRDYACPSINLHPFQRGPDLARRKIGMVTTAGLRRRHDRSFAIDSVDYRLLPAGERADFVMDHVSGVHDRTGFAQDLNTVLPLDRLDELAADGVIGAVAAMHYSFMGAADVQRMRPAAVQIAAAFKRDGVDTVLLSPV